MKIMIVDDSALTRKFIKSVLRQDGYEVDVADNGYEALERLLGKQYDLVITDINMPKMDGFELLVRLRKDDIYKQVPIILLSTESEDSDIQQGIRLGANLYLVKPAEPNQLLDCVRRLAVGTTT